MEAKVPTPKEPGLALLLAWLVPGAGHWYIARRARAVLYGATVVGIFVAGLWMGGGEAVSVRHHKWAFLLQIFDGPMTIVTAVASHERPTNKQASRPAGPGWAFGLQGRDGRMKITKAQETREARAGQAPSRLTDLGLTFTLVSAAFNVLVMADAYYLADKTDDEAAGKKKDEAA